MSISTCGHSEIRKRRGALHRAPDLVLVTVDAGSHPHTLQVSLETLCATQSTEEIVADETPPSVENGWIPFPLLRPSASKDTPTSHMTQGILICSQLPHTTMPNARRHPAVYPFGYCHQKRHKLSTTEAMAHRHTSFTPEGSRTRPTPASPFSTKGHAPSFS